jgi:hypothetical protein
MVDAFEDRLLRVLTVAGVFSIVVEMITKADH